MFEKEDFNVYVYKDINVDKETNNFLRKHLDKEFKKYVYDTLKIALDNGYEYMLLKGLEPNGFKDVTICRVYLNNLDFELKRNNVIGCAKIDYRNGIRYVSWEQITKEKKLCKLKKK